MRTYKTLRACARLAIASAAAIVCSVPAMSQAPDLVFSSALDNDLYYAAVGTFGISYPRYNSPLDAVNNAPNGAGVMILGDGYPEVTTTVQQQVLDVAATKNLKLYIEYPDTVPGLSLGGTFRISLERAVTDTNTFFGTDLQQWDILDPHEAAFVSVGTTLNDSQQHLRLARVAGYETAVYGYSGITPKPLLFEHSNSGVDMLISTTKMSNFVTGRYMPNAKWRDMWSGVLGWLDGSATTTDLDWTPTTLPTYGKTEPLPSGARTDAITRGVQWYENARLLIHPDWQDEYLQKSSQSPIVVAFPGTDPANPNGDGSLGILEGTANPIYDDGTQAIRWVIRGDVVGETAMSYALHSRLFSDNGTEQIARNLISYLDDPNGPLAGGTKSDPTTSGYGHRGWFAVGHEQTVFYSDDEARSVLGHIGVAAALDTQEYNAQIVTKILAQFQLTGVNGFWTSDRFDGGLPDPEFWVAQHQNTVIRPRPHFEGYKLAPFLWLYDKTGDPELLERSRSALGHMMTAYNNGTLNRTNGLQQERARLLLPLAWLLRIDDTPEHRGWLDQVFNDIVADMDSSGAIAEDLGTSGAFFFPPPGSNNAFGTNEAPVIQQNSDPAADLLYTSNFALKGLVEAAAVTGDQQYIDAAELLGEFMIRAQVASSIPELDGKWTRTFDFDRWDYWGSDSDHGWGALGDQAGWTSGEIISALTLLELDTSIWELASDIDVSPVYADIKADMFAALLNPLGKYDLNEDGVFDVNDWTEVFQPNLSRDLSGLGLTPGQAFALGDFNGNLRVDLHDFREFKDAYETEYGPGSFKQALTSVPEPTSVGLSAVLLGLTRCVAEVMPRSTRLNRPVNSGTSYESNA